MASERQSYHYSGPLPARLVLLSDLPAAKAASKVRFLGCVQNYDVQTGVLVLSSPGTLVDVRVDVKLLLNSLKNTDTLVGEWINVVGYITERLRRHGMTEVHVQALMLWSAGAIRVEEYEKAVRERENMGLIMRP
ncbi:MAG: hypothetical protein M1816_007729 [Peltula sp. TS41687]|nr:MAG: hypothetical protein M1816_007729 [Peltula sp. TS41687]